MKTVFQKNLEKAKELREDIQWAGEKGLQDCHNLNYGIRVDEVSRTYERQRYYWSIGRRGIKGEKKVTWSMNSYHLKDLAMDIDLLKWTSYEDMKRQYNEIEEVFNKYRVYRPPALVKKGDLRHFQFDRVEPNRFDPETLAPKAYRNRLRRLLARLRPRKRQKRAIERARKNGFNF